MELSFDKEHIDFLNTLENTNQSVFLTAKAGAGKSTMVNYFISKTSKRFILLGTTGISAQNIGGQTIHSFFGLIPGKKHSRLTIEKMQVIKDTDIFIIDEVSMMRSDLFDKINKTMKHVMENNEFMGGKQFVFVGDLFQLPPVPETNEELKKFFEEKYKGLFFFNGNSFIREKFKVIEFKKVYRQEDPQFINMLNRVRMGDGSPDVIEYFNSRVVKKDQVNPKSILIGSTNYIVDTKNKLELGKLPGEELLSFSIIRGEYEDMGESEYPADKVIKFKVGARVMFTANDKDGRFVNGTLGTITNCEKNGQGFVTAVYITIDEGGSVRLLKKTREITDPENDEDVIGSFTQFPFKLAFAITIHKVQGKSFDHVVIDLGKGAFVEGQTYVALSRCRSFQGLQLLSNIYQKDIKADTGVIKFMMNQNSLKTT